MADLGKYKLPIVAFGVVVVGLLGLIAWTAYRPPTSGGAHASAEGTTETPAANVDLTQPPTPAARRPSDPARNPAGPSGVAPAPAAGSDGCDPGLTSCGGACKNLREDSENCGACGNACRKPQWCNRGVCVQDKCKTQEGEAECNGVCKNLMTDPKNCGECGATCAADQTCKDAQCDPPRMPEAGAFPFPFDGGRPVFVLDGGRPVFPGR